VRSIRVLAVLLVSVLGLTAPVAVASAASTITSTKTVVYGFGGKCPPTGWAHPLVRPSRAMFDLACEDGIRNIHWRYWRRSAAFGHGVHLQFNGIGFTGQPAIISLSRVRTHHGRRYFSHLVMRWTTRNGQHHQEVFNWRHADRTWLWG